MGPRGVLRDHQHLGIGVRRLGATRARHGVSKDVSFSAASPCPHTFRWVDDNTVYTRKQYERHYLVHACSTLGLAV